MNKLKWLLVGIFGVLLFFLVRYNTSTSFNYKLESDVKEMKADKDSLFLIADSVTVQIELQKKVRESQIEQLKGLLDQKERNLNIQKENLEKINKEKEELEKNKEKEVVLKNEVMAVGFDVRGMEEEIRRNRQVIEQMSYYNSILMNELDSIKLQYDSLLIKYNQIIQK